jgi:hypothetical protein
VRRSNCVVEPTGVEKKKGLSGELFGSFVALLVDAQAASTAEEHMQ